MIGGRLVDYCYNSTSGLNLHSLSSQGALMGWKTIAWIVIVLLASAAPTSFTARVKNDRSKMGFDMTALTTSTSSKVMVFCNLNINASIINKENTIFDHHYMYSIAYHVNIDFINRKVCSRIQIITTRFSDRTGDEIPAHIKPTRKLHIHIKSLKYHTTNYSKTMQLKSNTEYN